MLLHGDLSCILLHSIVNTLLENLPVVLQRACVVFSVLRPYPVCCDLGTILSVQGCWRKPAGTEDLSKQPEESPEE